MLIHYQRGSIAIGIEPRSYAQVIATDPKQNLLTVENPGGQQITYDPSRLRGISAYHEIERDFTIGDRLQFTAPNKQLGIANRDIGTIQQIGEDGTIRNIDNSRDTRRQLVSRNGYRPTRSKIIFAKLTLSLTTAVSLGDGRLMSVSRANRTAAMIAAAITSVDFIRFSSCMF